MIDQADAKEIHTGWTYSQAGTPVAFVMPVNAPGDAMVIAFDNWWSALRFAVNLALHNGCEYVGGPDNE